MNLAAPFVTLAFPARPDALWSYSVPGLATPVAVAAPVVRLDDTDVVLSASALGAGSSTPPLALPHGVIEHRWSAPVDARPDLTLTFVARLAPDSPVVRFRYVVHAAAPVRLTNDAAGRNALAYLRVSLADFPRATEVRLSSYLKPVHSFVPEEVAIPPAHFDAGLSIMGPPLAAGDGAGDTASSLLLAYEHGSQSTNRFLEFRLAPNRSVTLAAVKGNYFHGRTVTPGAPYETIWFQLGAVAGDEAALAAAYRDFVLRRLSPNPESRQPYVFYNTWNHQERLKNWQKRPYLAEMTQERMLAEIDIAGRMGVDVFVIDTGWYSKTGDWRVDLARFPDGLAAVRVALAERGMKLGLWFNPTIAALTSEMHAAHRDCIQEWRGEQHAPHAHWEGEPSQGLCLVSRYADAYAAELIRLVRELGVTYFKWDAIGQEGPYSCDAPGHDHGGPENSPEERNACYGFEQVCAMTRIIDRVCAACPEAIFDFDITEPGRTVGLAFLAAGKYFLVNNGPYHWDYDLPATTDGNANLFFFPGPARAWICRTPLAYDKWIPSILFLTHYLPDGPEDSHLINAASLMLGQNGVWGDLLYASLLQHHKLHHAFVVAATSVHKANAAPAYFAAPGPGLAGHGKWAAFNPFMVLHHIERNRNEPGAGDPRRARHDLMFSNTARMWIHLVHADLEATGAVFDRQLVRGSIRFARAWLASTESAVNRAALDAVIADLELRLDTAAELRTDFTTPDLPGGLPFN